MDGVIQRGYDVHCAGCATWESLSGPTKKGAERALRRSGWRKRKGLWHCAACLEEQSS